MMLLYKFIFISDLNLIPMFSVFLVFLNISAVYLSETDDHCHGVQIGLKLTLQLGLQYF